MWQEKCNAGKCTVYIFYYYICDLPFMRYSFFLFTSILFNLVCCFVVNECVSELILEQ